MQTFALKSKLSQSLLEDTAVDIGAAMANVDNVIFFHEKDKREWMQYDHDHFMVFGPFVPQARDFVFEQTCLFDLQPMGLVPNLLVIGFVSMLDCLIDFTCFSRSKVPLKARKCVLLECPAKKQTHPILWVCILDFASKYIPDIPVIF